MQAYKFNPRRLEAPYYIVRYFQSKNLHIMGYQFGKSLLGIEKPSGLFIDASIYEWRFSEEVAICACWSGDKHLFKMLSHNILKTNLSEKDTQRISRNLELFA